MSFGIKINEEYASLVPPLSLPDYQRLKEGIELNGIHIPIIVNEEGEILDGHHRYKIHVVDLQRPVENVPYIIKHFDNKLQEKLFVINTNVDRRQLNDSIRAALRTNVKALRPSRLS